MTDEDRERDIREYFRLMLETISKRCPRCRQSACVCRISAGERAPEWFTLVDHGRRSARAERDDLDASAHEL